MEQRARVVGIPTVHLTERHALLATAVTFVLSGLPALLMLRGIAVESLIEGYWLNWPRLAGLLGYLGVLLIGWRPALVTLGRSFVTGLVAAAVDLVLTGVVAALHPLLRGESDGVVFVDTVQLMLTLGVIDGSALVALLVPVALHLLRARGRVGGRR